MKIINSNEVITQLSFIEAIKVMEQCFKDFQAGTISQEKRMVQQLPDGENHNVFAMMPAYLGKNRYFGSKIITAFPNNHKQNLPSHLGEVLLFDSKNGQPVAMVNANAVTWIRTAAVSALATKFLAKKSANALTLIGAGQQAASHLAAITCVRAIQRVFVYDLDETRRKQFILQYQEDYPELTFIECSKLEEATKETDIICTLTSSKTPILSRKNIQPGTHINAIGTFTPDTRELASDLMAFGQLYVDDYQAIKRESGDYLIPLAEGVLTETAILGSLGELVTHQKNGRTDEQSITIFDAVGLAVEDLCCAEYIYEKIKE
ncbi:MULTISPECIES: ornithine cyclodeaminase family protein [unclassified Enterococcus]|uniref:ornithine cyclodeaminase family protein n=1 Tax=unclassified Enterococcus TaxID=2608891 RepID=UPI001A9C01B7|nr:ornithine cyclodeaminase family protein [Enterococcus sp. DIV1271a]MBO1299109.1 ornithine cyclodeaminase family protein [Enterococcus sp. DIV1271a]